MKTGAAQAAGSSMGRFGGGASGWVRARISKASWRTWFLAISSRSISDAKSRSGGFSGKGGNAGGRAGGGALLRPGPAVDVCEPARARDPVGGAVLSHDVDEGVGRDLPRQPIKYGRGFIEKARKHQLPDKQPPQSRLSPQPSSKSPHSCPRVGQSVGLQHISSKQT